jgi:hypothetical protein
MVNMTLAIPEDLHRLMRKHAEIRWAEVARQAMLQYALRLAEVERLASKSRLTHTQAKLIGRKVKAGLYRRIYGAART